MSDAPASAEARTAPMALWRVAEAFLRTLYMLFGAPEDVAARHTLTARAHEQLASWLRCAEALMRRLIVLEAAACAKPAPAAPARARVRVRTLRHFSADAPEAWCVSFRCFGAHTLRQAQRDAEGVADAAVSVSLSLSKATRREPQRFRSAWPLAERYEALIRAFNHPAPYARRLARRLHAAPHRLAGTLNAPREAADRIEGFEPLGLSAGNAWRPHFSSA